VLKFPDRYYGGPFVRIENVFRDLPARLPGATVSEDVRARVEFEGSSEGERLIAPFHDANALPSILALLESVALFPACWDDDELYLYPTLQGALAEAEDRLRDKVSRAKASSRKRLFETALASVGEARAVVAQENIEKARSILEEAALALQVGNRTGRRQPHEFPPSSTGLP